MLKFLINKPNDSTKILREKEGRGGAGRERKRERKKERKGREGRKARKEGRKASGMCTRPCESEESGNSGE